MDDIIISNAEETYTHFFKIAPQAAYKAQKEDEVPIGAIIVNDRNEIVSEGYNRKEGEKNCTRHAEIIAIENASKTLGNWRLTGHTLYSTLEPCVMCAGAIVHARLEKVVYGAKDLKWGGHTSITNIFDLNLNHKTQAVYSEYKPCREILSSFFRKKRK